MEIRKNPFMDDQASKDKYMTEQMLALTEYHMEHCAEYRTMLQTYGFRLEEVRHYRELPFLPVTLFKKYRLSSLQQDDFKVITSSGTGGQQKSQIILDADTRYLQQQVLASICGDFLGTKRMPMLVIDCPATIKQRDHYSARTAGILGFSLFGKKRYFALRDQDLSLDLEVIKTFLENYGREPFLIFGFTYIVWQYFLLELEKIADMKLDFSKGILVHGGGWKKLQSHAVTKDKFKERLKQVCGITQVMDYYGMAEQAGSIFMECPCGHLHCSDYSAVLVRKPTDFALCETGEIGLIQVMSLIPKSYPGHNLLTEDMGRILGVDDCPCGRKGVYFEVLGRAKQAELRGCSDTFQAVNKEETTEFQWLIGSEKQLEELDRQEFWKPFSETAMGFLTEVFRRLRKHTLARTELSDVLSYGFWCRRTHLEEMKKRYLPIIKERRGKKVSLHFAASNVPVLFAFSMSVSLLAGNCCIVRMPRRESPQERVILQVWKDIMDEKYPELKNRILVCRYGHDSQKNARLSALCDVRVLWGSDESVREIQKAPIKETARDVAFGTRYSGCVLDARAVCETKDLDILVKNFYNDTYLNDQNACSSPRVIYWLGSDTDCKNGKARFWSAMQAFLEEKEYLLPETIAVQKLDAALGIAIRKGESVDEQVIPKEHNIWQKNRIYRIPLNKPDRDIWSCTMPGGFFPEYQSDALSPLTEILDDTFQTLTYFGIDEEKIWNELGDKGEQYIKRIVPVGHALDFSVVWDGYDLIDIMTE